MHIHRDSVIEFSVLLAVGIAAFLLTFTFDDEIALYRYGANLWPAILSLGLILCTVIIFVHTLFYGDSSIEEEGGTNLQTLARVFILPIFYVILLPYVGFYSATIIFLPLYTYIIHMKSFLKVLLRCLAVACVIIVVFTKFLFVPFPVGTISLFYTINSEIVNLLY